MARSARRGISERRTGLGSTTAAAAAPARRLLPSTLAGPSFAQMMAERQAANPEFAFLRGGEGAVYYSWLLQQSGATGAVTAPAAAAAPAVAAAPAPQQQQQQAAPHQAPSAAAPTPEGAAALAAMPAEVSSGWGQVLGLLSGSRDSIRNSQQWFMACAPFAAGMAEMLLQVGTGMRAGQA